MTKRQTQLQQQILKQLYTRGPISRSDIVRLTGITPATTSAVTAQLLAAGVIRESGAAAAQHQSGRRKILLEVAPGGPKVLGVELTASSYTLCIIDRCGQVYASRKRQTARDYDLHFLAVPAIVTDIKDFLNAHQDLPITAIGVAVPGHYLADQEIVVSANPTWKHVSLRPFNEAFKPLPVYYENNVHCETVAEQLIGPDKSGTNFTYLHVARGIFCSTIHDGHLYGYKNFVNGEIAHIIVDPNGELCDCGRRGCLQTTASHEWLVKKAKLLYENANATYLRQLVARPEDIHMETVFKAFQMGDQGVVTMLRSAIESLAVTLNTLALVIDANRIILHGQLFDQPQLLALFQKTLVANQFQLTSVQPQNVTVKPFGPQDGAIGGGMLAVAYQLLGEI
ncbi:ROK family transcriptional regulator [Lacticaseibacillus camelliae]|nr:ROK family transcriptional regulator [Lacticaseibacillus camelliae]